jgi:hypothetical protein
MEKLSEHSYITLRQQSLAKIAISQAFSLKFTVSDAEVFTKYAVRLRLVAGKGMVWGERIRTSDLSVPNRNLTYYSALQLDT